MKVCTFKCSHLTFPDKYKFCPYCGSKLKLEKEMHV